MEKKLNVTLSETFMMTVNAEQASRILDGTIKDFDFFKGEEIINVQLVEKGGAGRFWIYSKEK